MARERQPRRNVPCGFCKNEFFPSNDQWIKWRDGKNILCSQECRRLEHAALAHARNPDQPCTTCGKMFTLTRSQKDKAKSRPDTGLYCSTECLYASRKTNPKKIWAKKRGEDYFTRATCHQCNTEFVPTARQRQWSYKNPNARVFCTPECDHAWRADWMRDMKLWERKVQVYGPENPRWKHGVYSHVALEVDRLRRDIKKLINQGAKA